MCGKWEWDKVGMDRSEIKSKRWGEVKKKRQKKIGMVMKIKKNQIYMAEFMNALGRHP